MIRQANPAFLRTVAGPTSSANRLKMTKNIAAERQKLSQPKQSGHISRQNHWETGNEGSPKPTQQP